MWPQSWSLQLDSMARRHEETFDQDQQAFRGLFGPWLQGSF